MPGDVLDLVGVGLVQRCIVHNQQTVAPVHNQLDFLPQRLRVGERLCSRRVKASWAGTPSSWGCDRAASVQETSLCATTNKANAVEVVNLGRIHRRGT